MVTLEKISKTKVKFSCTISKEIKCITKCLTFFIDGAFFSEKYQNGFWDGKIKFYKDNVFSFGLTKFVCDELTKNNFNFELSGFDKDRINLKVEDKHLNEILYPYQKIAVKTFFDNEIGTHGIIKIPTRGGKTFTSAECISIAKMNGCKKFLFLVDSIDLMNQTINEFAKYFKISKNKIGKLQGSKVFDFKEINVGMIQSFTKILSPVKKHSELTDKQIKQKNEKVFKLKKLISEIDFIIVDEIHEFSSENRLSTLRQFSNCKHFLSLSATPFKSGDEVKNMNLRQVVGDVIYEIKESELIEYGSLVKNKVLIILFDDETKVGDNYVHFYEQNIVFNKKRNELLLKIMKILNESKIKSLFMVTRKNHGKLLSELSGYDFVSGDDEIDSREKIKQDFLSVNDGILLASDIYKKGVSLNNCEVLVNVSGGKEESTVLQKRGRVLASSNGKNSALIIDIFDKKKYFNEHCVSRLKAYQQTVGEENIDVLDFNDSEFYENLEYIIVNNFI